jgi:TPR repeat protein
MRTIFKALFLLAALSSALPVFAQYDFETTKARAEAGNAKAQAELGNRYAMTQNYEQALYWFKLAAEQGNADAQYSFGLMYANGVGLAQNSQEALRWYHLAADQGDAEAQLQLGGMYINGEGVAQDYQEAVRWFRLAADQGNSRAILIIEDLSQQAAVASTTDNNQAVRSTSAGTISSLSIWQLLIVLTLILAFMFFFFRIQALVRKEKIAAELEQIRREREEQERQFEKTRREAKDYLSISEKSEIATLALKRYDYETVSKVLPALEDDADVSELIKEFNDKLIPVYSDLMKSHGLKRKIVGEKLWDENLNNCLELGLKILNKHDFNQTSTQTSLDEEYLGKSTTNKSANFYENASDIRTEKSTEKNNTNQAIKGLETDTGNVKSRRWGLFIVSLMMVISHFAEMIIAESSFVSPYAAFWIYASYLALKDDMKTLSDWLKFLITINAIGLAAILLFNFDTTYLGMSKEEMLWGIGLALIIQILVYMRAKHLLGRSLV